MRGIMVKEDHSPNYSLASTLLNPSLPSENILRQTDILHLLGTITHKNEITE
jgi:hypothetical protein